MAKIEIGNAASSLNGMALAVAGFVMLSLGDAVVKSMAGMWAPTAIAATRYALGAIGLSALLLVREGRAAFAMPHPKVQILRGAAMALSTLGFFSALFVMPLAAATTITFISPMLTALLATLILGEPARKETWIALAMAFVGVLVVLRPNVAAVGWAAVFPLISALGFSLMMIGNRYVAGTASALAMQAYVALAATPILIVATFGLHFSGIARYFVHWPEWSVLARCALIACTATTAHWLIYLGTTRAGAAHIAPMTYVQLLVATLLGWLFFNNHPDRLTLLGAVIIIGSGLYFGWASRVRTPG